MQAWEALATALISGGVLIPACPLLAPELGRGQTLATLEREDAELGAITSFGSGCPPESLAIEARTGEPLVIGLGAFALAADHEQRRERKSCQIRVEVLVPEGFQVGLEQARLQGEAEIGAAGRATVSLRYFEGGSRAEAAWLRLSPESEAAFTLESPAHEITWLGCGRPTDLLIEIDAVTRQAEAEDGAAPEAARTSVTQVRLPALTYKRCAHES